MRAQRVVNQITGDFHLDSGGPQGFLQYFRPDHVKDYPHASLHENNDGTYDIVSEHPYYAGEIIGENLPAEIALGDALPRAGLEMVEEGYWRKTWAELDKDSIPWFFPEEGEYPGPIDLDLLQGELEIEEP